MPRDYSDKFLLELSKQDESKLGIRLARLCVRANLPAAYAAVALETSPTTVYGWFRGRGIREQKYKIVEVLIDFLNEGLLSGRLPVNSNEDAKAYIKEITGIKI